MGVLPCSSLSESEGGLFGHCKLVFPALRGHCHLMSFALLTAVAGSSIKAAKWGPSSASPSNSWIPGSQCYCGAAASPEVSAVPVDQHGLHVAGLESGCVVPGCEVYVPLVILSSSRFTRIVFM